MFLFGAEIAHTSGELAQGGMQLDDEQSDPHDAMVSPWDMLAAALAVAGPYAAGQGPVSQSDIVARLRSFAYNLLRADGCDNLDQHVAQTRSLGRQKDSRRIAPLALGGL